MRQADATGGRELCWLVGSCCSGVLPVWLFATGLVLPASTTLQSAQCHAASCYAVLCCVGGKSYKNSGPGHMLEDIANLKKDQA